MAKLLRDSYTGEVASEYYTSDIQGINEPKGLFKERFSGSTASYKADRMPDGTFDISRCAQEVHQLPGYPLCSVADENWANRILDWLVIHDAGVFISISRMMEGDFDSFFMVIEQAMKETITS